MDSPPEQGPVGRGDTQHGASGVAVPVGERSPREMLAVLLYHASCSGGTRMSGDNLCLCSSWAVSVMNGSLLFHVCRMVSPWGSWCAALQSSSGAELGLSHLRDPMGNV